jgi:hypothetical protein
MRERMLFRRATFCLSALALLLAGNLSLSGTARSQDAAEQRPVARAAVAIEFLPPPLESATYSLGIYDLKTGKLIRHLHEIAPESAFTVGTNGLVTSWDGKDDAGQKAPPGRYAARGYAVGPMKVEGTQILGNDWASDDDLRIRRVEAITVLPDDVSLAVLAEMAVGPDQVASFNGPKSELRWHKPMPVDLSAAPATGPIVYSLRAGGDIIFAEDGGSYEDFRMSDGFSGVAADVALGPEPSQGAPGKDGTVWKIDAGVLDQYSRDGERLRRLSPRPGDPVPIEVCASKFSDRLYLLEEKKGWQRLRGMSWVETKEEDSQSVSTWQTFFERNIRAPDPALGLEGLAMPIEISLIANPLEPGKPQKINLAAAFDDKGSYLTTADGLRLRQISQQPNLRAAKLEKSKGADGLTFFQSDTAAWDEFSIEGAKNIMAFDAGEFELTATGEKPVTEKAPEPDL